MMIIEIKGWWTGNRIMSHTCSSWTEETVEFTIVGCQIEQSITLLWSSIGQRLAIGTNVQNFLLRLSQIIFQWSDSVSNSWSQCNLTMSRVWRASTTRVLDEHKDRWYGAVVFITFCQHQWFYWRIYYLQSTILQHLHPWLWSILLLCHELPRYYCIISSIKLKWNLFQEMPHWITIWNILQLLCSVILPPILFLCQMQSLFYSCQQISSHYQVGVI